MAKHPTYREYFITVGQISQNAVLADAYLLSAFHRLSGIDMQMAKAIYYGIDSLNLKGFITVRVAKLRKDESITTLVNEIVDGADQAQSARNEVAHVLAMPDAAGNLPHRFHLRKNLILPVTAESMALLMQRSAKGVLHARKHFNDLAAKLGVSADLSL